MEQKFEPELILDYTEKAHLAAISSTPGYHIINRIARAEVDKFILRLINTDTAEPEKVIIDRHRDAKVAAQIYAGMFQRLNNEIYDYTASPRDSDKPLDVTQGVLDIGDIADQFKNIPNFFQSEDEGPF